MIRGLWFFAQLVLLVVIAVLLAAQDGPVTIRAYGRLVETTVGVLAFAVIIGAFLLLLLWQLWRGIRRTPHAIGRLRLRRRRSRGQVALLQALSAIAAGDGATALKLATEAEAIGEPALAHLAAAQAAELAGDDGRAEAEYAKLSHRRDTALIGLRGGIGVAERKGEFERAASLARQVRGQAPKSPWMAVRLFELELQLGNLAEAEQALADARKLGAMSAAEADRRQATLLLAKALRAEAGAAASDALSDAERAHALDPALERAALLAARLLVRASRIPAAERVLTETWRVAPSSALAAAWIALAPRGDTTLRLRQAERLHALDRDSRVGRLALAEVEMAAGRLAEARSHLAGIADLADPRYYLLMAYLESASGNEQTARSWLERSPAALPATFSPSIATEPGLPAARTG